MAYKYIESSKIEVFPMAKERGTDTPGNRLLTEKNISNMIRQLLPMLYADGFMISYSDTEDGGKTLYTVEFNLHGYYFKLTDIDIDSEFSAHTVVYAEIDIDENDEIRFSDNQPSKEQDNKFGGFKLTTSPTLTSPHMELFRRATTGDPFEVTDKNFIRNMISSIGGIDGKH